MTRWERLIWRWQGLVRWVRAGATALWLVLLGLELTSDELDVDRFLRLLLLGGGAIFVLRHYAKAAMKATPRLRRKMALWALAQDPVLASDRLRKDVIPFLLGRDSEKVSLYPWRGRFESLMVMLIHKMLSSPAPRSSLEEAMIHSLALLHLGRGHWRTRRAHAREADDHTGGFHGLDDEELLQFLLLVLTLLSALFRLHLLLWGMPRSPLDRENLSRLRGRWIRFCMLEPTTRSFPPPFPREMVAVIRGHRMDQTELASQLIGWIFRAEQGALSRTLEAMCKPRGTAEVSRPPQ